MKYFDIETPVKKMNGWDRSLLELKRMMNGNTTTRDFQNTRKSKGKARKNRTA